MANMDQGTDRMRVAVLVFFLNGIEQENIFRKTENRKINQTL